MSIKFILVDLDGVIRHWLVDNNAIEKRHLLAKNSLFKTAFSDALLLPAIRGERTDNQWRQAITETLKLEHPEANAEQAVAEWSESNGTVDADVLALLKSYQPAKLALVTNATSRLMSDLLALGIDTSFDYIFNSSDIGYIKPELKLFNYVLHSIDAAANEVLFIDDSLDNVIAARAAGINSFHYTDFDSLKAFLAIDAGN